MFKVLLKPFISSSLVLLCSSSVLASSGISAELNPEFISVPVMLAEAGLNLRQAAGKARKTHGGKVVKAETVTEGGRKLHQIRLVKDGRVKTVRIDAATGTEIAR